MLMLLQKELIVLPALAFLTLLINLYKLTQSVYHGLLYWILKGFKEFGVNQFTLQTLYG